MLVDFPFCPWPRPLFFRSLLFLFLSFCNLSALFRVPPTYFLLPHFLLCVCVCVLFRAFYTYSYTLLRLVKVVLHDPILLFPLFL